MGGGGDGIDARMLITVFTFLSFLVVLIAYATPIFVAGDIDTKYYNVDTDPRFEFTGQELVENNYYYNDSTPRSQYGYNVSDFAPGDHISLPPWWMFILYPNTSPLVINGTIHTFYDAASAETRTIYCGLVRGLQGSFNAWSYFVPDGWDGWVFYERWGPSAAGQYANSRFDFVSLDEISTRFDSSRNMAICTISLRTMFNVYYKFDFNETNGELSDHLEDNTGYYLTLGEPNAEDYVNSPQKAIGMVLGLLTFTKQLTGVPLFDYFLGIVLWVGVIWIFIAVFGRLFTL
jgi:hypothetical protein